MTRFAFRRMGPLILAVRGSRPPLDEEWRAYMVVAEAMDREHGIDSGAICSMAITDGGSPTAPQRAALAALMKGRGVDSAVVSDSMILRVAITLVGIINPGIKVFPSREWKQAAAFVRATGERERELLRIARELDAEVGGTAVMQAIAPSQGG